MERFDAFWRVYPARNGRKLGKHQALTLFRKLREEQQEDCIRAAGIYAEYCTATLAPGEFRPAPRDAVRFLRNDWWMDWLEPQPKPCGFRSAVPCEREAEPGERLCQVHRDYVSRLDQFRAQQYGRVNR